MKHEYIKKYICRDSNELHKDYYLKTFWIIDKDCMPKIGDIDNGLTLVDIKEAELDPMETKDESCRYFELTYEAKSGDYAFYSEGGPCHRYVAYYV